MYFVAYRNLINDTSVTINGLSEGFLSREVKRRMNGDDDWINLSFFPFVICSQLLTDSF